MSKKITPLQAPPATCPLPTAGLLVINQDKILLAYSKNKQAWYLPGGKIDPGETPVQSLVREIEEELQVVLSASELRFCFHISAPAFGEAGHIIMEQDCFLGPVSAQYKASSEVGAIRFFSLEAYTMQAPVVPGVLIAFKQLQAAGLIP